MTAAEKLFMEFCERLSHIHSLDHGLLRLYFFVSLRLLHLRVERIPSRQIRDMSATENGTVAR